jgi:hypothetical protein
MTLIMAALWAPFALAHNSQRSLVNFDPPGPTQLSNRSSYSVASTLRATNADIKNDYSNNSSWRS